MFALFLALLFAHALADFPLQGDFLARAKNHRAPVAGVPWMVALAAHAAIHGGLVTLATGSVVAGCLEYTAHVFIDYAKSDGLLGEGESAFTIDQLLHVACKAAWVLFVVWTR